MDAARVNLGLSLVLSGDAAKAAEVLQPLATRPGAPAKVRHDYASALAMAGDRAEAERMLSPELKPDQVRVALAAFAQLRP
jgi:Flp pilus assembly protein TadD